MRGHRLSSSQYSVPVLYNIRYISKNNMATVTAENGDHQFRQSISYFAKRGFKLLLFNWKGNA